MELYPGIMIYPETMGKRCQLGNIDEVLEICGIDDEIIPAVDFAHIHALGKGSLNSIEAFEKVFDKVESSIGRKRMEKLHCHYSKVQFTDSGEKRHESFKDKEYGPEFEFLAAVLVRRGLSPVVICESRDDMAEDALEMKRIYNSALI
jgi:deoxyribonuclease-4